MAGPWDQMNPEFASRVQALIAASGGRISPGSGFRTVEEQVALRKKNGCPNVWTAPASSCRIPTAIPGRSNHNHGLAMDLVYSKDGAQWAAQNAARFGLHFPVKGENWHVEMIDDDGSRSHVHGAQRGGAIGFDMEWQSPERTPQDELSYRLDSIIGIIGGKGPGQQQSDALVQEGELRQDTTALGPEAPQGMSQGVPAGGGEWAGGVPPPGYVPPGQGVERWRPVVVAALRYTGHEPTPEVVNATLRRMSQESGGQHDIVQKVKDVNSARGDPAKGLMQNIGSAFAGRAKELAGRGIFDGFANIVASIRYVDAHPKYRGDLVGTYNRRGGY